MFKQIKRIRGVTGFRGKYIIYILLIHFVAIILSLVIPKLTALFIDYAIPEKSYSILIYITIGQLLAIAISCITQGINMFIGEKITLKLIRNGQVKIFSNILKMPLIKYNKYSTADLVHVVNNDIVRYISFMKDTVIAFIVNIITLVFVLMVIFISNWFVGLISIILTPLFAISFQINNKKLVKINKEIVDKNVVLSTIIYEKLDNKLYIESCAQNEYEINNFSNNLIDLQNKALYQTKLRIMPVIVSMVVSSGIMLLVYFVGSIFAINGALTAGSIVAISSWITMTGEPINSIAMTILNYQTTLRSIERSNEIIDMILPQDDNNKSCEHINNIISENVSFSYTNSGELALDNFSIFISQSDSVAIIGTNGAGKSTFTKLLLKLYDNYSGCIKINNTNISEFSIESVRKRISYVPQNVVIWRDTILNNILYTRKEEAVDYDLIYRLIKVVQLETVLDNKESLDNIIGENGFDLSGGERQKIALLRALYSNADVLILDEATSNIDVKTETQIYDEIKKIYPDIILIVITHRILSISNFNKIILLEHGKRICAGTHDELMQNTSYIELYKHASAEESNT